MKRVSMLRCIGLAAVLGCALAGVALADTEYEWSMDLDCAACHEREATGTSARQTSEDVAAENSVQVGAPSDGDVPNSPDTQPIDDALQNWGAMHVSELGIACAACHEESAGLDRAHAKLNSGRTAKRLKKTEVGSDVCLTCHDADDLTAATAHSAVLTDNEGTTVNPHDLPDVEKHAEVACVDCHKAHDAETSLVETSVTTCTDCHHAGVYACGTCHE